MKRREQAVFVSAADEFGDQSMTADVAIAEDAGPRFTGIYDRHGNKIYAECERVPMGFVGP